MPAAPKSIPMTVPDVLVFPLKYLDLLSENSLLKEGIF